MTICIYLGRNANKLHGVDFVVCCCYFICYFLSLTFVSLLWVLHAYSILFCLCSTCFDCSDFLC